MLAAIEGDAGEVLQAATFDAAVFGAIAKDHVATADNTRVAIGVEEGIGIAGIDDVVGQDHAFAAIPGATSKGVGSVKDGVVDDLQIQCLALMIGTGEACACTIDEDVVAHDGLALHLHDVVGAIVAEIALDDIHGLPSSAIHSDAGVIGVVNVVLNDQITPGALLHLDAIALIAATIMNVIQRDDALAHDMVAVVGTEIHAFRVTVAVVDVIAGQKEALGVGTIGAEADFIRVMDVALIDPDIAAMPEA